MSAIRRIIPVFSASFSVLYVAAFGANFAPFIFYPAIGRLYLTKQGPDAGPAMFWYGWLVAALAGASVVSLCCLALPQSWTSRIPRRLSWIVTLIAIAWLIYLERRWFAR